MKLLITATKKEEKKRKLIEKSQELFTKKLNDKQLNALASALEQDNTTATNGPQPSGPS